MYQDYACKILDWRGHYYLRVIDGDKLDFCYGGPGISPKSVTGRAETIVTALDAKGVDFKDTGWTVGGYFIQLEAKLPPEYAANPLQYLSRLLGLSVTKPEQKKNPVRKTSRRMTTLGKPKKKSSTRKKS